MIKCECGCTAFSVDTQAMYNVRIDVDTNDEAFVIQHDVGDYVACGFDLKGQWWCNDCGQHLTEEQSTELWKRYLFGD